MLRRVFGSFAKVSKQIISNRLSFKPFPVQNSLKYQFSSEKGITAADIPEQNLKIKASEAIVGEERIDFYRTEGGISILDKVQGVKSSQTGQLYVLSFTCTKCNTKSIRSFTKHAYHKGVVLIRCDGCQNTHLVADNLGWFADQPVNLQTTYEGKVQKVHDHVAIVKFLKTAFEDENPIKKEESSESAPLRQKDGQIKGND